jgi:hypothetical protein
MVAGNLVRKCTFTIYVDANMQFRKCELAHFYMNGMRTCTWKNAKDYFDAFLDSSRGKVIFFCFLFASVILPRFCAAEYCFADAILEFRLTLN